MARKFAFVMDPLDRVLIDKDTTFAFMLEALARGHQIYHLGLRDMFLRGPRPFGCGISERSATRARNPGARGNVSRSARRPTDWAGHAVTVA